MSSERVVATLWWGHTRPRPRARRVSYLYLTVASSLSILQSFEVPVVVSALLLRPAHVVSDGIVVAANVRRIESGARELFVVVYG